MLIFYAPLCGFKKQFRNCFCNAAHSREQSTQHTRHTAYSICSHELHIRIPAGWQQSYRATEPSPIALRSYPFPFPTGFPNSSPNNAVVIVVFTSIKSWQLFLPCLPNLARTRTGLEGAGLRLPLCRFVWLITELQTVMAAIVSLAYGTPMASRPQVVTAKKRQREPLGRRKDPALNAVKRGRSWVGVGCHATICSRHSLTHTQTQRRSDLKARIRRVGRTTSVLFTPQCVGPCLPRR